MELKFRNLRANEIDVRVATVTEKGFSLLLYKDARCDMNILDETVGAFNWQRSHSRDNANCTVSIWDSEKSQWISKEDTGTESFTEKEKGLASDSFKRACFNWGIGRELYTSPFIWVNDRSTDNFIYDTGRRDSKGKTIYGVKERFSVKSIEVVNGIIDKLTIVDSKNNEVFNFGTRAKTKNKKDVNEDDFKEQVWAKINKLPKERQEKLLKYYGVVSHLDMTIEQLQDCDKKI